jgi:hypothetical protein
LRAPTNGRKRFTKKPTASKLATQAELYEAEVADSLLPLQIVAGNRSLRAPTNGRKRFTKKPTASKLATQAELYEASI